MGILQDMAPWFTDQQRADFIKGALTYLPGKAIQRNDLVQIGDRFGTHFALIYNRRLFKQPPKTTDELVALAEPIRSISMTMDARSDTDWYGISASPTSRFHF